MHEKTVATARTPLSRRSFFGKPAVFLLAFLFAVQPLSALADTVPVSTLTPTTTPAATPAPTPGAPIPASATAPSPTSPASSSATVAQPAPDAALAVNKQLLANGVSTGSGGGLPPVQDSLVPQKTSLSVKPNQSTGALSYEYAISTPDGRNGQNPSIALDYNSQDQDNSSIVGYGWTLNTPYIQRVNTHGTDQLYTSFDFNSSLSGDLTPTSSTTGSTISFAAKVDDGSFLSYSYNVSANTWTVTDKKGTVYVFGATTSAQESDPANPADTFKWDISSETDTNGNAIQYTYFDDGGQVYPQQVSYSVNGSNPAAYSVTFSRSSRADNLVSFATGFQVQTNYVISSIRVAFGSSTVDTYTLSYSPGANGARSLLSSIQQTAVGSTGLSNVEPAETFAYTQNSTGDWWQKNTSTTQWQAPIYMPSSEVRIADVNGDGLPDIIISRDIEGGASPPGVLQKVFLNTGHGAWVLNQTWTVPVLFMWSNSTFNEAVVNPVEMMDVNGDGKADIVMCPSSGGSGSVYINNGNGWTEDDLSTGGTWSAGSFCFAPNANGASSIESGDVNGEGLLGSVSASENEEVGVPGGGQYITSSVNTNTGSAVETNPVLSQTTTPAAFTDINGYDYGTRLVDVNGDGLADLVQSSGNRNGVNVGGSYLNEGNGKWLSTPSLDPQNGFVTYQPTVPPETQISEFPLVDINNDGIMDYWACALGTGNTYNQAANPQSTCDTTYGYSPMSGLFSSFSTAPFYVADLSGDGSEDVISTTCNQGDNSCFNQQNEAPITTVYMNTAGKPDLLSTITSPLGATSSVTYKPSTQYFNADGSLANPNLPTVVYTVQSITTTDPVENVSETDTYSYAGGQYLYDGAFDRKFGGFATVTDTDAAGNETATTYKQADPTQNPVAGTANPYNHTEAYIGKVASVEQYSPSGALYLQTVNTWIDTTLGAQRDFPQLQQTVTMEFDGGSAHDDTATGYTYDSTTGNVLTEVGYGQVTAANDGSFTDVGSDDRTTTYTYASGGGITGLPDDVTVTNQAGTKIKENRYNYDSLPFGSVTLGNQTKENEWLSGSSTYNVTHKSYNAYGLVATSTDADGNVTTYTYDAYNLYPATVLNALSQATTYTYDYACGTQTQVTTPNSTVSQTTYDGLCRPLTVKRSDPNTISTLDTVAVHAYYDTSGAVGTAETDATASGSGTTTFTYLDGLGRQIQSRKSAVTSSNTYEVQDTVYNNVGLVAKQSLPYFLTGTPKTAPTTNAALLTTYTYDPLQRVISSVNAVGTTGTVYAPWEATTTDPLGEVKSVNTDAYGNISEVSEHNGSSAYNTNYTYDGLNDLTGITDANGNIRNFSYDGIGRQTYAEDLHAPGATTFGKRYYVYDGQGNLTSRTDANSVATVYTYDALNREHTEAATGISGTTTTYTYDTCTLGIGFACTVATPYVSTAYTYNGLGLVASESETIGGTAYPTSYTYDWQGHELTITNPDGSIITYTYNAAGLPYTATNKESAGSTVNVLSSVTYSPTEQPVVETFGSGDVTTNTYDASHLYRLSAKVTTIAGGVKAQNTSYTYDADGDITGLVDSSSTDTSKTVAYTYDGLNRLLSATVTGVASGQAPYAQTYTYDAVGNILTKSDVGTYSYSHGSSPGDPDAVASVGSESFTYDSDGNVLGAGTPTYTYNHDSELTGAVPVLGTAIAYGYNQSGERVSLATTTGTGKSAVTTIVAYPTKGFNTDGTNVSEHVFLGGVDVADVTGGVIHSVHDDQLTGASIVTNASGAASETLDYFPFGSLRIDEQVSGFSEQRKFDGHEYDASTGLSYQDTRYYDPSVGRFYSEDPAFLAVGSGELQQITNQSLAQYLSNPQDLNSYSYVLNNPMTDVDPKGETPQFIQSYVGNAQVGLSLLGAGSKVAYSYASNELQQQWQGYLGFRQASAQWQTAHPLLTNDMINLAMLSGDVPVGENASLGDEKVNFAPGKVNDPEQNAQNHFVKHQADFPELNNAQEYAQAAEDFTKNPPAGSLTRVLANERVAVYNPETNTLGFTQNGMPSSMYKPSLEMHEQPTNLDYFNSLK